MFNQRSEFLYVAASKIYGYFVRKDSWNYLLQEYDEIGEALRMKILGAYLF